MSEVSGSALALPPGMPKPAIDSQAVAESHRVQTLRGLACVLLVAFHVIGSRATSGLHVDDHTYYRLFANFFMHVRMPLFTFLSGFVYAYRPVAAGQLHTFARKKFVRLWLPLVCVSTLYFLAAMLVRDATGRMPLHQVWRIYVFPYVHFWFLQAMILIFAAVVVLERLKWLDTARKYATILAVAIAIHLLISMKNDEQAPFSFLQALYLAPFFLLGLGANRFATFFVRPIVIWICVGTFVVAMTAHVLQIRLDGHVTERGTVLGLLMGATSALTLLRFFPRLRPLELIGAYSFTIYLFHPFFVAGARTALKMAQNASTDAVFVVGLIAGVLGPAVLERVLGGIPIANQFLFGQGK